MIQKGSASGWWAVALPNGGVAEVEISQKKVVRTTPGGSVTYARMPVLTDDMKRELEGMLEQQLLASRLQRLARYGASGRIDELRRFLSALGSFPLLAGCWVRWGGPVASSIRGSLRGDLPCV